MIDREIIGWRAWYTEERVYDSDSTRWEQLPRQGALVFVFYLPTNGKRHIMQGQDYYWKHGDCFDCDNDIGKLPPGIDGRNVKMGKEISDDKWRRLYAKAYETREPPA